MWVGTGNIQCIENRLDNILFAELDHAVLHADKRFVNRDLPGDVFFKLCNTVGKVVWVCQIFPGFAVCRH